MGCTRKNPADKMSWLEGEIRKCKEKRNEKDGSQTNDIWNTREPGMWSQCDGMLSACAGIFYRTLFRTGKRSCAACFYVHRNDSVYAADRSGKIRGDTDRYDRCSEADRMGK